MTMSNPTAENPSSRGARKTRLRALFFFVLALVAGLGAVMLVHLYLDQAREHARHGTVTAAATASVVVASTDIRIGAVLEAADLETVTWPEAHLPPDSFERVDQVVGMPVVRELVAGAPILRRQLADPEYGDGLALLLAEEGTRAMTVSVDRVIGVFGFIQPGDFVDVITTMSPDGETESALDTKPGRFSKIVLQNIRVLAVGEHIQVDRREPRQVQAVTLQVLPEESERLALASDYGRIQLTLRSPLDQAFVPTPGITPLGLLLTEESALDDLFAQTREELEARKAARTPQRAPRPRPVTVEPKEDPVPVIEMFRGGREVEARTLRRQ
jgi:pilus assembly protein CpaB